MVKVRKILFAQFNLYTFTSKRVEEILDHVLKGGNGWNFAHFGQKSLFHFIEQI